MWNGPLPQEPPRPAGEMTRSELYALFQVDVERPLPIPDVDRQEYANMVVYLGTRPNA